MNSGVYTITNLVNKKMYVGLAIDFDKRWDSHKNELRNNKHCNYHLQAAWNKYGENNFLFEILVECEEQFLYSEEHYWATILNVHNPKYGYNIQPTHPYGKPRHAEETKKKIAIATLGNTRNVGRIASPERVVKIRETKQRTTGKPIIILDKFGNYICEKPSKGEVAIFLGKTRRKIGNISMVLNKKSKSIEGYILIYKSEYNPKINYDISEGYRLYRPIAKYSLSGEFLKIYDRVYEAARDNNLNNNSLQKAIDTGKGRKHGGFLWRDIVDIGKSQQDILNYLNPEYIKLRQKQIDNRDYVNHLKRERRKRLKQEGKIVN